MNSERPRDGAAGTDCSSQPEPTDWQATRNRVQAHPLLQAKGRRVYVSGVCSSWSRTFLVGRGRGVCVCGQVAGHVSRVKQRQQPSPAPQKSADRLVRDLHFCFCFSGGSCSTDPSLESVYVQTPFVVPGSSSGQSTASMKLD